MEQALHIFRKDIRYLRREIAFIIALSVGLVWTSTRSVTSSTLIESLMIFAASYLIGRLIHAEAIPGIRQFWITRPYRWRSLLIAKLLFIFAFVNIPVLLAQLVILLIAGFSLHAILPGLLWCQFLLFAGVALPVAAVASLTPGTVAFIFTGAILLAIGLNISTVLVGVGLLWFGTVEWVRDSVVVGAIIAFAAAIVYWQYSKRSTRISRLTGFAGLAVAISCYAAIPWTSAFRVQAGLAKGSVDLSGVSVSLDSKSKGPVRWARKFFKEVDLPLRVAGIPPGIDLQVENIAVTLRSPSGAVWKSNAQDATGFTVAANEGESEVTAHSPILVDEKFFEANRKRAVKLELAVYLTAFGDKHSKNISISEGRTEVMPGLHCGQGPANTVACIAAFRWPGRIVEASTGGGRGQALTRFISYSPFPAEMTLNPLQTRFAPAFVAGINPGRRDVTITVKEPLAHVRRDFQFEGFSMEQFAFTARR